MIAVLGGVLANQLQADEAEEEQKKQLAMNMRLQYAKSLDPDVPTYGLQAAQARSQMDAQRDASQSAMIGSLLPIALQGMGQAFSAPSGNDALNQQTARTSSAFGRANERFNVPSVRGAYQVNPFRFDDEEF